MGDCLFGTTLKYAECTLSLKYREMDALGNTAGGPMYTIENGLARTGAGWLLPLPALQLSVRLLPVIRSNPFTVSDQLYSEISNVVGNLISLR